MCSTRPTSHCRIVSWQKAITLLFQGKVEVIAVYDREIRGVTVRVKLPSVLRLLRHVRMKRAFADVPFSRANVYARDDHRCQYCGARFPPSQLTFDHVIPVARGGHKGWDNIVTCCIPCNREKGDLLPRRPASACCASRAGPRRLPSLTLSLGVHRAPDSWRDYLFWDISLGPRADSSRGRSTLSHEPRAAICGRWTLPDVLQWIATARKTGTLHVERRSIQKRIILRERQHLLLLVERPARVARPVPDPPAPRHRGAALQGAPRAGGEGRLLGRRSWSGDGLLGEDDLKRAPQGEGRGDDLRPLPLAGGTVRVPDGESPTTS